MTHYMKGDLLFNPIYDEVQYFKDDWAYAKQDAVLAQSVFKAPQPTKVVFDKVGKPHQIVSTWSDPAFPVVDAINQALQQYAYPPPQAPDDAAKQVLQYWRWVAPITNEPSFDQVAFLKRRKVQWDHDLAIDGEVLAAGAYTWDMCGFNGNIWGLGFFTDQHGGMMAGAIDAHNCIRGKITHFVLGVDFKYRKDLAIQLLPPFL